MKGIAHEGEWVQDAVRAGLGNFSVSADLYVSRLRRIVATSLAIAYWVMECTMGVPLGRNPLQE